MSITKRYLKTRTILIVMMLLAATLAVAYWSLIHVRNTRRRHEEAKLIVSKLLRDFHLPYERGLEFLYERFMRGNPRFLDNNNANRGAELLFAMFEGRYTWSSDTDGDGRMEQCDDVGDPLIFLTSRNDHDVIIGADGTTRTVYPPPYYCEGFYINLLSCHTWFSQEAFEDLQNMLSPTTTPSSLPVPEEKELG